MSQDHTIMGSRYELKYLIHDSVARKVREFLRQHLEIDEFGALQPDLSYPVHSLYLDSDDWKIYHRTLNGDKNRFKLRLRYYSDEPRSPVFFEIKRRMKDIILKSRCLVRREAVPILLAGQMPDPGGIKSTSPDELHALQQFQQIMLELNAGPKLHIAYDREAWVNDVNNEVRVTMDRNVRAVPRFDGQVTTRMDNPLNCSDPGLVILELKFTGRFPDWYKTLVRHFDCFQTGAAKYVESVVVYQGQNIPESAQERKLVW